MVSIIIRTKDEERWITPCLKGVYSQDYKDFEVIIVDNESTDKTIEKATQFNIDEILTCKNYKPGFALNMGIRASKGENIHHTSFITIDLLSANVVKAYE